MTIDTRSAQRADARPARARRFLDGPASSRWLWMWPALTTLVLAAIRISGPQMDTDELVTWDVARRGIGRIMATLQRVDAVHGTYYLLMHGWLALFGDSTIALRAPSALAMGGAAVLVALTGRRLFGVRAGVCGGLLFAVVPAVSRFGQEARSYAMVIMVAALATFLLLRALDAPRSWWRWGEYALCVVALGLLHLVALAVLTGHVVAVAVRARSERRAAWGFLLAVVVGLACLAPVVLLGRSQVSRQLFWVPRPTALDLVGIWPQIFASSVCAGALVTLALFARRARREPVLLCAVMAVLPPLLLWAVSCGDTVSYFRYQYLLVTLPAWAVLAGAGLAAVTRSWLTVTSILAVLALLVLPDQIRMRHEYEHDAPWQAQDYAGAARLITSYYRPGDGVVYNRGGPWMLDQGVRYYLPRGLRMREVFLATSAADNNELYPLYCPEPARCLRGERRIWLVVPGDTIDPLGVLPVEQARALRAGYAPYRAARLPGLTVALLLRRTAGDSR